jgi:hypothetical protein
VNAGAVAVLLVVVVATQGLILALLAHLVVRCHHIGEAVDVIGRALLRIATSPHPPGTEGQGQAAKGGRLL